MKSWAIYIPGALMILFGILIALIPEILVALIASFFIITGISTIGLARAWKSRINSVEGFFLF